MCNFNCKIRLQTFQMFLTKLKQKYKKIELLKNFCKNQIGFLQSQNLKKIKIDVVLTTIQQLIHFFKFFLQICNLYFLKKPFEFSSFNKES